MEDDFYNKLEKLNDKQGKGTKFCWRMCNADAKRITQHYQQIHGSSGADATMSMENIGEQVYV